MGRIRTSRRNAPLSHPAARDTSRTAVSALEDASADLTEALTTEVLFRRLPVAFAQPHALMLSTTYNRLNKRTVPQTEPTHPHPMILIITNKQDLTADFVVREITRRGLAFARLNTDEFPINACASVRFEPGETSHPRLRWFDRERILEWRRVRAVWYRRPVAPIVADAIVDPGVRKFASDEAYDFLRGLWYSLSCFWISNPDSIRRAEHKIVQLNEAHRIGFTLPRTLISNSAEEVRDFFRTCPDGIVAKPLFLGFLHHNNEGKFIYTTRLAEDDLSADDEIQFTPSIYQQYVPKTADIRVTVVGDRVFATRITARNLPANIPDWRCVDLTDLDHAPYELPDEEKRKCVQLLKMLRLEFGAIDYVLDEAGQHVFLEINPNGQWAWLESATGVNISAAIVDHLVAGQKC